MNESTVSVDRLVVATAADLLRDTQEDLEAVDATGPYYDTVTETIEQLDAALN